MNTLTEPHAHNVVSRDEWLAARKALLAEEKKLTRVSDELACKRRTLPWVRVEKDYVFDTIDGPRSLSGLFDGRSQLFVYHFMLAPDADQPCTGCSFLADHVDAARQHFEHADLSFAAISRATVEQIEKVKARMGWGFTWASSNRNRFNYDYCVSFTKEQVATGRTEYNYGVTDYAHEDLHGCSIFAKDGTGEVFHTYSCYARGGEILLGAFHFLDMTPKGRNEQEGVMSWVRRHDEYENDGRESSCCSCHSAKEEVLA